MSDLEAGDDLDQQIGQAVEFLPMEVQNLEGWWRSRSIEDVDLVLDRMAKRLAKLIAASDRYKAER